MLKIEVGCVWASESDLADTEERPKETENTVTRSPAKKKQQRSPSNEAASIKVLPADWYCAWSYRQRAQESPWLLRLLSSSIRWPFTHCRSILAQYSLLGKQGNRKTADRRNCWHFSGRFLKQSVKLLASEYCGDLYETWSTSFFSSLSALKSQARPVSKMICSFMALYKLDRGEVKWQNYDLLSALTHHLSL